MDKELWEGPLDVGRTPTEREFVQVIKTLIEEGIDEVEKVEERATDDAAELEVVYYGGYTRDRTY